MKEIKDVKLQMVLGWFANISEETIKKVVKSYLGSYGLEYEVSLIYSNWCVTFTDSDYVNSNKYRTDLERIEKQIIEELTKLRDLKWQLKMLGYKSDEEHIQDAHVANLLYYQINGSNSNEEK